METYDLLMLLVLLGATMFGFFKGFAWQLASVASLVVSYLAALRFSPQLAPMFGSAEPWNRFVAMLAIYIATSFFIWTAFRMVASVIDRMKLKEFDRQMGAMVGFAKGVLWCIAITFFAVSLLESQRDRIMSSRAGRYIVQLLDQTDAIVPREIHDVIGPYIQQINQRLDPSRPASPAPAWPTGSQTGGWPQASTAGTGGWPTTAPAAGGWSPPTQAVEQHPAGWPASGTAGAPGSIDWSADNRVPAQPVGTQSSW